MLKGWLKNIQQEGQELRQSGYKECLPRCQTFYLCPDCSAVVKDWRTHRDWHEKLRKAVDETGSLS